jgi:hypothetical protein
VKRLAEREARQVDKRIARLESRIGILRQQRDSLLDWLLREALRFPDDTARAPTVGERPTSPRVGTPMAETG